MDDQRSKLVNQNQEFRDYLLFAVLDVFEAAVRSYAILRKASLVSSPLNPHS